MEPRVVDNPDKRRYEIYVGDDLAGFAEYHLFGGEIAFTHTEIRSEFEGQGLAGRLAREALDTSRGKGRDVLPYCPYFAAWIGKHPDYLDLVPRDHRTRFGLPEA